MLNRAQAQGMLLTVNSLLCRRLTMSLQIDSQSELTPLQCLVVKNG